MILVVDGQNHEPLRTCSVLNLLAEYNKLCPFSDCFHGNRDGWSSGQWKCQIYELHFILRSILSLQLWGKRKCCHSCSFMNGNTITRLQFSQSVNITYIVSWHVLLIRTYTHTHTQTNARISHPLIGKIHRKKNIYVNYSTGLHVVLCFFMLAWHFWFCHIFFYHQLSIYRSTASECSRTRYLNVRLRFRMNQTFN